MTREDYSDKMIALCRKQTELKASHQSSIDQLDDDLQADLERLKRQARQEKTRLCTEYRKAQLELEIQKQTLKTQWSIQEECQK